MINEPVAWAVMSGDIVYDIYDIEDEAVAICLWLRDEEDGGSWVAVPLYQKHPQPAFTDAELKAVRTAAFAYAQNDDDKECAAVASALLGLAERLK